MLNPVVHGESSKNRQPGQKPNEQLPREIPNFEPHFEEQRQDPTENSHETLGRWSFCSSCEKGLGNFWRFQTSVCRSVFVTLLGGWTPRFGSVWSLSGVWASNGVFFPPFLFVQGNIKFLLECGEFDFMSHTCLWPLSNQWIWHPR